MGARSSLPDKDAADPTVAASDAALDALVAAGSVFELVARGSEALVQHALLSSPPASAQWLVRDASPEQRSVLHAAVLAKRASVLRLLLAHKVVDVDVRDATQSTALHVAAYLDDAACVSALVEHGAAVDAQDAEGMTPLLWATRQGALRALEALLRAGADASLRDARAASALDVAQRLRPASLRTRVLALLSSAPGASRDLLLSGEADSVATQVALARLWHTLWRAHPYLAYRVDLHASWSQVALTALRALRTDGANVTHVTQRLVHALQDADTHFERDDAALREPPRTQEQQPPAPRPQPYAELSAERVGVVLVTHHTACASLTRLSALHTALAAAFSQSRAVVVDARALLGAALDDAAAALLAALLEHALCAALGLDARALLLPTTRERAYSRASHVFVTHAHTLGASAATLPVSTTAATSSSNSSAVSEAAVSQGKRLVLLLDEGAGARLTALACALQQHGVDFVFELRTASTRHLDSAAQLLLREPGVPQQRVRVAALRGTLTVRVAETVLADHGLAFRPDLVLVRAADDRDDARALVAAQRLALRTIASQRRALIPLVSAREELVAPRLTRVLASDADAADSSALLLALTSVWQDFALLSPLHVAASSALETRVHALLQRSCSAAPASASPSAVLHTALTELLALLGDEAALVLAPQFAPRIAAEVRDAELCVTHVDEEGDVHVGDVIVGVDDVSAAAGAPAAALLAALRDSAAAPCRLHLRRRTAPTPVSLDVVAAATASPSPFGDVSPEAGSVVECALPRVALELVPRASAGAVQAHGHSLVVRVAALTGAHALPTPPLRDVHTLVVDWRPPHAHTAPLSETPRVLAWLLGLGLVPHVAPLVETTRSQLASELWTHEVALTRRTRAPAVPATASAPSASATLTLVLDEAAPACVLHAAKRVLLALPTAHALLVTPPSSAASSASQAQWEAAAASLTAAEVTRVQVTATTHVLLTTALLEYPAPTVPVLQRVTRVAPDATHPALQLLRDVPTDARELSQEAES